MRSVVVLVSLAFVAGCDLLVPPAYDVLWPGHAGPSPGGAEEACAKACVAHAVRCSPRECARGCNLILDRLVEREGEPVLACVARQTGRCDDRTWAACAVRVGPYADGGPPAPRPPPDDFDEDP